MRSIIVNVTAEDIRAGKRKSISCCPVALALARQLNEVVMVAGSSFMYKNRAANSIDLPSRVHDFVMAFDRFEVVRPFRFTLHVPR